jgi:hypothetical protein
MKFRQPIFKKGKFIGFHYWGLIQDPIDDKPYWKNPLKTNIGQSQRFTGVIDQRSEEVYEGDICTLKYYYSHDYYPSHIHENIEIKYIEDKMAFMGIGLASYPCHINAYELEVTDNIYQKEK